MKKKIINFVSFQVGWTVCILGGDLYAIAYTTIALLVHHRYIMAKKSEWQFIAIVTIVGCLWDTLMVFSGMIYFPSASLISIPYWLICLWILFATTIHHALSWLDRYLWVAAGSAVVLGPSSYWFGSQLSDAYFGTPILTSMLIMAAGWSVIFPASIYLARRYK